MREGGARGGAFGVATQVSDGERRQRQVARRLEDASANAMQAGMQATLKLRAAGP